MNTFTSRSLANLGVLAWMTALVVSGCGNSGNRSSASSDADDAEYRVWTFHAAPCYSWLRAYADGDLFIVSMEYLSTHLDAYPVGNLSLNVDKVEPNGGSTRLTSFATNVRSATSKAVVIAESGGALVPIVADLPDGPGDLLDARMVFVHAVESLGDVDVYIEPFVLFVPLNLTSPIATLSFREITPTIRRSPGDYAVVLTGPADPTNILVRFVPVTLEARPMPMVLVDGTGMGTSPIHMMVRGKSVTSLPDDNVPAIVPTTEIRVINTISDRAPRDFYVDNDFSAPWIADVGFGAISDFRPVPPGPGTIQVTPAGNTGVIEAEASHGDFPWYYTYIFSGEPGQVDWTLGRTQTRPIYDRARVTVVNGVNGDRDLEALVRTPAPALATIQVAALSAAPAIVPLTELAPASAEIVVRERDTLAELSAPFQVELEARDVYTLVLRDGSGSLPVDAELVEVIE